MICGYPYFRKPPYIYIHIHTHISIPYNVLKNADFSQHTAHFCATVATVQDVRPQLIALVLAKVAAARRRRPIMGGEPWGHRVPQWLEGLFHGESY